MSRVREQRSRTAKMLKYSSVAEAKSTECDFSMAALGLGTQLFPLGGTEKVARQGPQKS